MKLDIDTMIAGENDPQQRAFLIVLNSINNALVANTATIRDVSDKLETHLTNFDKHTKEGEELLNKGKGAWKVTAVVLGMVQFLVIAYFSQLHSDIAILQKFQQEQLQKNVGIELRVDRLEKGQPK